MSYCTSMQCMHQYRKARTLVEGTSRQEKAFTTLDVVRGHDAGGEKATGMKKQRVRERVVQVYGRRPRLGSADVVQAVRPRVDGDGADALHILDMLDAALVAGGPAVEPKDRWVVALSK